MKAGYGNGLIQSSENENRKFGKLRKGYLKQGIFFIVLILYFCPFFPVLVNADGMITIDANKKYEGMNAPFSKGYEPAIKKNAMILVIPFATDKEIKNNRIIVGISFEREENSPFYYKNYQKKVKKSEEGIYLYECKIKLKEDRVNGQYPLHLFVQAQTEEENIQQEFTLYVEITDGNPKIQTRDQTEEKLDFPGENGMSGEANLSESVEEISQMGQSQEFKEQVSYQPRVIMIANSLQNTPLQAGDQVLWSVSAKNCSSQSMENVKVTLISENKNISFEKNSWYFTRAGAGTVMDFSQNIMAGKKATAESVTIQFQFEYEDNKGIAYTSTETVNLPIVQVSQAELTNLSFPESIYESDTDLLTFQIQNTGLAIIYNAKVRLEGKGLFPEKEMFLGNIEAGTSSDGEISVFAGNLAMDNEGNVIEDSGEKYGDTLGVVTFSYENEQGEVVESSQELHIAIKKPQVVELKVEKEVPKTNQWWITILVGIFLVLIFIIVWLYLRMKHYQKRCKT